jgi:hypothetical protein
MAVRPRAASVDSVINYAAARAGGGPVDGPPPGAAEAARAALGTAARPLLRAQVDRLDAATGAALGEDDEPRERAAGAAAGPWAALDAAVAAVTAAEDVVARSPSTPPERPVVPAHRSWRRDHEQAGSPGRR